MGEGIRTGLILGLGEGGLVDGITYADWFHSGLLPGTIHTIKHLLGIRGRA